MFDHVLAKTRLFILLLVRPERLEGDLAGLKFCDGFEDPS